MVVDGLVAFGASAASAAVIVFACYVWYQNGKRVGARRSGPGISGIAVGQPQPEGTVAHVWCLLAERGDESALVYKVSGTDKDYALTPMIEMGPEPAPPPKSLPGDLDEDWPTVRYRRFVLDETYERPGHYL